MGNIRHQAIVLLLAIIFTMISFVAFGLCGWESVGCFVVYLVVFDLFLRIDDNLPIGEIALFLGAIQWIIAPMVSYHSESQLYPMAVPVDVYMSITIPIFVCFALGVYLFRYSRGRINITTLSDFSAEYINYAKLLIGVGIVLTLIPINIPSLNFIKVLLGNLIYIGGIMYMYAKPEKSLTIALVICSFLFLRSITFGMFHDLMVWGLFILVNFFYIRKTAPLRKMYIFSILLVGVMFMQIVKPMYREQVWYGGYSGNKIELFFNMFTNSLTMDNSDKLTEEVSTRFNQGWIISRIYNRIPDQQPYYNGKTIIEGVEATLLPRFLAPNKKGAGEQSIQDFRDFTGYNIGNGTSMGLSILGESYGNFGVYGACLFMFIWGMLIQLLISYIKSIALKFNIIWLMFIPLICFNIIKAEINFISVLNWTVKTVIFSAIIIYMLPIIFKKNNDYTILSKKERRS